MTYLPPTAILPYGSGVAGTTIVVGTPILLALGLAFALCVGAIAIGALMGRRHRRPHRWPALVVGAVVTAFARRHPREA